MNGYSIVAAIAFLAIGIVELAVVNRTLYPALRWRYEKAKLTQEQGMALRRIMLLVRIQSLILMPLLGLALGKPLKSIFG